MHRIAALAPALLLTVSLAACGGGGGPHGATEPPLTHALAVTPHGASELDFTDRAAIADRAGVGDIGPGASSSDIERYVRSLQDVTAAGTDLVDYLPAMTRSPFDELDVDWEIAGQVGDEGRFQVYRMTDSLDLDTVARTLHDAGYQGSNSGAVTLLSISLEQADPTTSLLPGGLPPTFTALAIDPGRHLLIVNGNHSILPVLDGSSESAASDWTGLTDELDGYDQDYLELADHPSCPLTSTTAGLGRPSRYAFAVGDAAGSVDQAILQFGSPPAATADAEARSGFLSSGRAVGSGESLSTYGTYRVTTHGDVVKVAITPRQPDRVVRLAESGDGPLVCGRA